MKKKVIVGSSLFLKCCRFFISSNILLMAGLHFQGPLFSERKTRRIPFVLLSAILGVFVFGCALSIQDPESNVSSLPVSSPSDQKGLKKIHSSKAGGLEGNSQKLSRKEPRKDSVGFPVDLKSLPVADKKKLFIETLVPLVHEALDEVEQERSFLLYIVEKIGVPPEQITLADTENLFLEEILTPQEREAARKLTKKYRHVNAAELLERIHGLPISLVLAQAALESSWGVSRFAVLGNNLFGMWTWGGKGIVPLDRDVGKTHKVAVYDSLLDSVRAYILNINRHSAYDELRQSRLTSFNPIILSEGLKRYSERGLAYVDELQQVIRVNRLMMYDGEQLAAL